MTDFLPVSPVNRWAQGRLGQMTRQYAVAGVVFGAAFPAVAMALRLSQAQLPWNLLNLIAVQSADPLLWIIDTAPLFLGLLAGFAGLRQDSLTARNAQLQDREQEFTSLKNGLEQRVAQRSGELAQRNARLRAAVDMTRQIAEIGEASTLSTRAVELFAGLLEGFDVDLYLTDERAETVALEASSSHGRNETETAGHALRVGDTSLVGQAALLREVRLGSAVGSTIEPGIQPIRLEIALPLTAHGQLIGVLHLRPTPGSEAEQIETEILQLLADQLAATLDRARLLDAANASVAQLQSLAGARTRDGWQTYSRHQHLAFQYTPAGVRAVAQSLKDVDQRTLRVPLTVRGQEIGSLAFRAGDAHGWSDDDRDLVRKAAAQVALALENHRLLEETRQRALLEQRASEISDRFSRGVDVDTLLQTAVRELAALPDVSQATVFLSPDVQAGKRGVRE